MTRRKFSADDRQKLVARFLESRMTQAAFAAQAGVCPRTLRLWLSRHRPPSPTGKSARNVLLRAAATLREAALRLEASVAGVELAVADDGTADDRGNVAEVLVDSQIPVATAQSAGDSETDALTTGRDDKSPRAKKFTFD